MFTPYLYILGDPRDLKMIMIFYMQVCKVKDSKRSHMSTFAYHALLTKVVECQMEIVNNHYFFPRLNNEYFDISVTLKKMKPVQYVRN